MTLDYFIEDWPFLDLRNVAVFTSTQVIFENYPILYVVHDSDGTWQFHTGGDIKIEDAKIVALSEIVTRDPRILALAGLSMGWIATRTSQNDDWERFEDL